MRTTIAILAVLLFTGWTLSEVKVPSDGTVASGDVAVDQASVSPWRHTADGWEKISDWEPITTPSVSLHPVVVGLFLLFISIFALIGFEAPAPQKSSCSPRKMFPGSKLHFSS